MWLTVAKDVTEFNQNVTINIGKTIVVLTKEQKIFTSYAYFIYETYDFTMRKGYQIAYRKNSI